MVNQDLPDFRENQEIRESQTSCPYLLDLLQLKD